MSAPTCHGPPDSGKSDHAYDEVQPSAEVGFEQRRLKASSGWGGLEVSAFGTTKPLGHDQVTLVVVLPDRVIPVTGKSNVPVARMLLVVYVILVVPLLVSCSLVQAVTLIAAIARMVRLCNFFLMIFQFQIR